MHSLLKVTRSKFVLTYLVLLAFNAEQGYGQFKISDEVKPVLTTLALDVGSLVLILNTHKDSEELPHVWALLGCSYSASSLISTTLFSKEPLNNFLYNTSAAVLPLTLAYFIDDSRFILALAGGMFVPALHFHIYSKIENKHKMDGGLARPATSFTNEKMPHGVSNYGFLADVITISF